METTIAVALLVMGVGIAAMWTHDIVASQVDLGDGVLAARDPASGSLFWPHWLAEYATAIGLIAAGVGLLVDASWSRAVAGIAAGSLLYTSVNSLGWALAEPDRRAYTAPMLIGTAVAITAIAFVLST